MQFPENEGSKHTGGFSTPLKMGEAGTGGTKRRAVLRVVEVSLRGKGMGDPGPVLRPVTASDTMT